MKNKKSELNVDFVGGQGSLTSSEEEALSKYFQENKKGIKKSIVTKKDKSVKFKPENV
jgi:hypothetical protein